ncbi:hypothetical protein M0812_23870 [Anaeramoeba flamelloides]|uniref:Uncharacterized protein n=1 Tax=Anaeramoeba flamelloides TaxID=1746091 RepID=A0AAV7YIX1_9EUKA|nr:hypothetical protein M0812_23870 [Anaeramoeba flamelloides]
MQPKRNLQLYINSRLKELKINNFLVSCFDTIFISNLDCDYFVPQLPNCTYQFITDQKINFEKVLKNSVKYSQTYNNVFVFIGIGKLTYSKFEKYQTKFPKNIRLIPYNLKDFEQCKNVFLDLVNNLFNHTQRREEINTDSIINDLLLKIPNLPKDVDFDTFDSLFQILNHFSIIEDEDFEVY